MDLPASRLRRLMLTAGPACLLAACGRPDDPAPQKKPLVTATHPDSPPPDWLVTPGAPPPQWALLDAWQERITRADFERLLNDVLAERSTWFTHLEIAEDAVRIRTSTPRADAPWYTLRFARPEAPVSTPPRYWRRLDELPPLRDPAKPLEGVHIAMDPGHLGGVWSVMEERHIEPGGPPPVKEGDITLRTAEIITPMLEALGARVSHVRSRPEPLTPLRWPQLMDEARASLRQSGGDPDHEPAVEKEAQRLFYRTHEIRARAELINERLRPDLVLHLHFDADAGKGFSTGNHLHLLVHGMIDAGEFKLDDQRLDGLMRLVQRIPDTEIPLGAAVAKRMAAATGLPAHVYHSGARMVPGEPYVWIRNLLAHRIYRCPVVFTEPYVMNNAGVIERIRAGDYEGTAKVAGKERLSIFREYAGGVVEGLKDYFAARKA